MFSDPVAHLEILAKHGFEVEWYGLEIRDKSALYQARKGLRHCRTFKYITEVEGSGLGESLTACLKSWVSLSSKRMPPKRWLALAPLGRCWVTRRTWQSPRVFYPQHDRKKGKVIKTREHCIENSLQSYNSHPSKREIQIEDHDSR